MAESKSNAQLWDIYKQTERAAYAGTLPAKVGQRKGQWLYNQLRLVADFYPVFYGKELPWTADPFNNDANIPAFRQHIADWLASRDND